MEVVPAIIAKNFKELKEKVKMVENFCEFVQIDVMDKKFVPSVSWPYFLKSVSRTKEIKKLKWIKTKVNFEIHLMIERPEKEIDKWILSGAKRILVHFESTSNLNKIIKKVKNKKIEIGAVLKTKTPIKILDKFIDRLDVVQLMGINKIGYHGQKFNQKVLKKIEKLRKKHPSVKIEVDGGINSENAGDIVKAGVNILVVGSYIWQSKDKKKAINLLLKT